MKTLLKEATVFVRRREQEGKAECKPLKRAKAFSDRFTRIGSLHFRKRKAKKKEKMAKLDLLCITKTLEEPESKLGERDAEKQAFPAHCPPNKNQSMT